MTTSPVRREKLASLREPVCHVCRLQCPGTNSGLTRPSHCPNRQIRTRAIEPAPSGVAIACEQKSVASSPGHDLVRATIVQDGGFEGIEFAHWTELRGWVAGHGFCGS
jgi:hypothetical protein